MNIVNCKGCTYKRKQVFCDFFKKFIVDLTFESCSGYLLRKPKAKTVKEMVNTFWTVENKDGYRVIVTAPNKSIARSLGVSKLFNLGKNPNIATITN